MCAWLSHRFLGGAGPTRFNAEGMRHRGWRRVAAERKIDRNPLISRGALWLAPKAFGPDRDRALGGGAVDDGGRLVGRTV